MSSRSRVMHLAWPIIASNLSTPLLGLVDTAVIGNLGDTALIGAIAIGGVIFSFLYWGFGFLRMGTTGLVAQAVGAGDFDEVKASFYRPLLIGAVIGTVLFALQIPLGTAALLILDASDDVETAALTYFQYRILGAPISLAHLAIVGFLLGQQRTRALLLIQVLLNGINILLDLVFVVGFGWDVEGVALATVIAEVIALAVGLLVVVRILKMQNPVLLISRAALLNRQAISKMFSVNRDIMVRTLCLIFAFAFFTNAGAQASDVTLAANAILMQFVSFSAFFLDGFALAAETLVGHAIGARDDASLRLAMIATTQLAFITSLGLSLSFWSGGPALIHGLTNVPEVQLAAAHFLPWAVAAPVISVWCYLLDGIFIGATSSVAMRNAMIASLAIFLIAYYLLEGFGNHGLWATLMIYFIARAACLGCYLPRIFELSSETRTQ